MRTTLLRSTSHAPTAAAEVPARRGPWPAGVRDRVLRTMVAAAVALALADASIVALGLPPILDEFDAGVNGAAGVLGIYAAGLALALLPAERMRRRMGTRPLGVGGLVLFAGSGACAGAAGSLALLDLARALQAVGAAATLVAAFAVLGGGRLWRAAAVVGTAAGPALGGVLTEAVDWRAVFYVQAPVALLAAAALAALARAADASTGAGRHSVRPRRPIGPLVALGLVSAALGGVLFLLVLLLVAGWSMSPLGAAAALSVLPVAALVGSRLPGTPRARAAGGALLVGAGLMALAWLPEAHVAWTIAPQVLAGVGMGLAVPALAGGLLPERTPGDAAVLLIVRHLGITLALVLLAPVVTQGLDEARVEMREKGAALILDAQLTPLEKLGLAGALVADLDPVDPRAALERSLAARAVRFEGRPAERAAYADLRTRADEVFVDGVTGAFSVSFLICGGLALLAVPAVGRPRWALAAFVLPAAMAAAEPAVAPPPVRLADPCEVRAEQPRAGGIEGGVEEVALGALDWAACRFGSSREELALAVADRDLAERYEREHGVNPRELAGGLLGGDSVDGLAGGLRERLEDLDVVRR